MSIGTLTLTLRSPFLIGGEERQSSAIDAVTMRDAGGERAIVPGSVIKGVLRDALDGLAALGHPGVGDLADRWFGTGSDEGGGNTPNRGGLAFGDLVSVEPVPVDRSFYARVAIDSATGSAQEGALQFVALPWPVGTPVTLVGAIHGERALLDDAAIALMKQAFLAVPAIGSMRGIGFGRLSGSEIERANTWEPLAPVNADKGQDLLLRVRFDGPFVVASERPDDNSFAGSAVVPGAALKGAIADRFQGNAAALARLSAVTVNHGYPVKRTAPAGAATAAVLPASLAMVPGAKKRGSDAAPGETLPPAVIDMMMHADDVLIDRGGGEVVPLHFATDWKPSDADAVFATVAEANGWQVPIPRRDQRTRAAIDGARGTARAGKLFSIEAVAPIDVRGDALDWEFRLSGDPMQLRALAAEIGALSLTLGKLKTGARAISADVITARPAPAVAISEGRAVATICLTTAAILTRLARIEAVGGDIANAYAGYFAHQLEGLRLDRFFAAQRLLTGYQALRYLSSERRFEPWIATEPGAIFRVSVASDRRSQLEALVKDWARHGLPPDGEAGDRPWETVPLARENGFGAITSAPLALPPLPPRATLITERGA